MQSNLFRRPAESAWETISARRRRFITLWLLVSGFWLLISLVAALEMSWLQSASLSQSIWFALGRAAPWIFLTPVIFWVSSTFTLERTSWKTWVWSHSLLLMLSLGLAASFAYIGPSFPILRRERDNKTKVFHIIQRVTLQIPSFFGLVGVSYALWFYERGKARELREAELVSRLTAARLQALRMQLNPHFLFNTLNSIASLIHEKPQAADEMIGALSELLRVSLKAPDRQEVSLKEELQFLDLYLQIELTRFGNRLVVERQIQPAALDALVPILILQPLVENAVKHGVEARINPSVIRIEVRHADDMLRLKVTDNGPGVAAIRDGDLKEGVGLSNTRSRLKELYGSLGVLELGSGDKTGFTAEIRMPWRTDDQLRVAETVALTA